MVKKTSTRSAAKQLSDQLNNIRKKYNTRIKHLENIANKLSDERQRKQYQDAANLLRKEREQYYAKNVTKGTKKGSVEYTKAIKEAIKEGTGRVDLIPSKRGTEHETLQATRWKYASKEIMAFTYMDVWQPLKVDKKTGKQTGMTYEQRQRAIFAAAERGLGLAPGTATIADVMDYYEGLMKQAYGEDYDITDPGSPDEEKYKEIESRYSEVYEETNQEWLEQYV